MWLLLGGPALAATWYVPADGTFTEVAAQAIAGDVIEFAPGIYTDAPTQLTVPLTLQGDPQGGTILQVPDRGTGPSIFLSADLVLRDLTFDGLGNTQVFQLLTPSTLTWERVTVRNAVDTAVSGGALLMGAGGALYATDVSFIGNSSFEGGALYLWTAALHCTRCTFVDNRIPAYGGDGGAIWTNGPVTLLDSTFTGNVSADWHGGALSVNLTATIAGGSFVGNQATYDGGAITVRNGASLTIAPSGDVGTSFEGNLAANGGAIGCPESCSLSVEGARFSGNTAVSEGGHISVNVSASLSLRDSTFELGLAGTNGGAVAVDLGSTEMVRSLLCNNQASGLGGAIWALQNIEFDNVAALYNFSPLAGGAIWAGGGRASFLTALGNDAPDGSAVAGMGGLLISRAVLVDQLGGPAVGGLGPVTVEDGATWNNASDYAPSVVTVLSSTALSRSPFPTLPPGDCALPIPEWQGELVRSDPAGPYEVADPDGTQADLGATGGPLASPPLWQDLDLDGVVAMWDCDDLDPTLVPPDCAPPDTGDSGLVISETSETGLAPVGPGETGLPSNPPAAEPERADPLPPRRSVLPAVVGCGCHQRSPRWPPAGAVLVLALLLRYASASSSGRPITRKA